MNDLSKLFVAIQGKQKLPKELFDNIVNALGALISVEEIAKLEQQWSKNLLWELDATILAIITKYTSYSMRGKTQIIKFPYEELWEWALRNKGWNWIYTNWMNEDVSDRDNEGLTVRCAWDIVNASIRKHIAISVVNEKSVVDCV